ncbi:MAG: hypothetical protein M1819_002195 [Sarea resinae]|nr:MAG: hypothetical protein M1819_002195 [Sarea resinae]
MHKKRVAIVGSGCAGLGALWALRRTGHEVHLYEAADRLGGHTNTVTFHHGDDQVEVDTGFIVFNTATYPNFIAFLKEIGVPITPTEMTFGVSRDQGAFEWAGTSLSAVFAQRSNIFRPSMWRMLFDIIRFNQFALDLLSESSGEDTDLTIGEYLDREGYSQSFRDDYLIPMTAAVWSTSPDKCALEFPAVTLVRFLWNHHLLSTISARPQWLTIKGGAQQYIDAVMKDFPKSNSHLNCPIQSLRNDSIGKVVLTLPDGSEETFDHVILATHGDQALDIIRDSATREEKDILDAFKTSPNVAVMHSDLKLMPRRPVAWSAWNYLTQTLPTSPSTSTSPRSPPQVSLTYNMNTLQHIPTAKYGPVLVTLNPPFAPAADKTAYTTTYAHPLYNAAAIRAQQHLARIQDTRGIGYAGAWTKFGFHEDGFTSGLRAAGVPALGGTVGFEVVDAEFVRGREPGTRGCARESLRRLIAGVQGLIWLVGWLVGLFSGQGVAAREREKVRKVQ